MPPETSVTVHPVLAGLGPGLMVQYTRDSAEFVSAWNIHRGFNRIEVVNNSAADVAIDLDFDYQRRILIVAKSARSVDMLWFSGFNLWNLDAATTIAAGKLDLNVMWERPLAREK
jgi:hypothetical protein